ncbi:hypothetical protein DRO54_07260 [Candidatus Bathyarchaeota archaeon]|nr:MAG: hypothetical protein DRO54_07260 [Candidatus Bathyarchaeota archaeon]
MATFEEEKKRFRLLWARVTMILAEHRNLFRNKNDVIEAALDALEEQLQNNPGKLRGRFKKK